MFVLNFYVIVYTLVCYNQLARIGADDNDARDEKRRVTFTWPNGVVGTGPELGRPADDPSPLFG
jgi:hypothetical protein